MNKEDLLKRITIDEKICYGKPVIGKMNRPLANILNLIQIGRTNEQIIDVYGELETDDIEACRLYDARQKYIPTDRDHFEDAKNGLRPYSDFEWFATDGEDNIARFTSAGVGAIPQMVFRDFSDYINLKSYIENLPNISDYKLCVDVKYSLSDFIEVSKKGIYAYDWDADGYYKKEPYSQMVYPTIPLKISEIDKNYRSLLAEVCFRHISFRDNAKLLIENFFDKLND